MAAYLKLQHGYGQTCVDHGKAVANCAWPGKFSWSGLMKLLKAAILSAALVSIVAVAANAADPVPTTPANPQIATNPGLPYSSTRYPGPKTGPSNWIPSPYTATPDASTDTGSHDAGKGLGPKTN